MSDKQFCNRFLFQIIKKLTVHIYLIEFILYYCSRNMRIKQFSKQNKNKSIFKSFFSNYYAPRIFDMLTRILFLIELKYIYVLYGERLFTSTENNITPARFAAFFFNSFSNNIFVKTILLSSISRKPIRVVHINLPILLCNVCVCGYCAQVAFFPANQNGLKFYGFLKLYQFFFSVLTEI